MEEQIEQIKDALRQVMQAIARRGQPISAEVKALLAQVIQHAGNRISQLRQEQSTAAQQIPPGADLLWILSGGNADSFVKYLGNVPDPALNALSTNPALVQSLVQKLSAQITLPSGEVQQGIPHAPLNSSNIYGFAYDPRTSVLRVKFQGDGVYEYEGVPPAIFKIFQAGAIPARTNGQNQYGRWWIGKNPSLGASFYQLIRDRFPYQKVS